MNLEEFEKIEAEKKTLSDLRSKQNKLKINGLNMFRPIYLGFNDDIVYIEPDTAFEAIKLELIKTEKQMFEVAERIDKACQDDRYHKAEAINKSIYNNNLRVNRLINTIKDHEGSLHFQPEIKVGSGPGCFEQIDKDVYITALRHQISKVEKEIARLQIELQML